MIHLSFLSAYSNIFNIYFNEGSNEWIDERKGGSERGRKRERVTEVGR